MMDDDDECGAVGGMIGRGKPKYLECHFVHHKSHMTEQGWNLGRRSGKPASNRLGYGTAMQ
jgi:hypothetical protein